MGVLGLLARAAVLQAGVCEGGAAGTAAGVEPPVPRVEEGPLRTRAAYRRRRREQNVTEQCLLPDDARGDEVERATVVGTLPTVAREGDSSHEHLDMVDAAAAATDEDRTAAADAGAGSAAGGAAAAEAPALALWQGAPLHVVVCVDESSQTCGLTGPAG